DSYAESPGIFELRLLLIVQQSDPVQVLRCDDDVSPLGRRGCEERSPGSGAAHRAAALSLLPGRQSAAVGVSRVREEAEPLWPWYSTCRRGDFEEVPGL